MDGFFDAAGKAQRVTHGCATFELPILYFRDDLFLSFLTVDAERARAAMPSDNLHPVTLPGGRALLAIGAFNYLETSIGSYGEVAVALPAVYGRRPVSGLMPALQEGNYPGFGTVVLHLPVTRQTARDAGRGVWGYTKFVADMEFSITPEYLECAMEEDGLHILTLRVPRRGIFRRDHRPLVTYSVKDGALVRTVIPARGSFRMAVRPKDAVLELGRHPVADSIRELDPSPRPLLSRYYVERSAILPEGTVLEEGVRALDGYRGRDGDGRHEVRYR